MIRRLKKIIVFLLIVISIYSTIVFCLLMSIHADSRLQQIDYLEKTKPYMQQKVLFMDRMASLNDRIRYFTVSRLTFKVSKPKHCQPTYPTKALLIISASAFDPVTIYIKIMRELELGIDPCEEPDTFVVKRSRPLAFNTQENLVKFSFEIGEIIKFLTIEAEYELNIFSYEQGSLLTLLYFARKPITILLTNIVERIKTILFVDIAHPFIRIKYDPPYKFMNKIKKQIYQEPERMKIFNKMKLVFIATHYEDTNYQKFLFTSQNNQVFSFANTILISSREIANVHYYLPPNSLSFPPFVRRIGHFLSKSFSSDMSVNEIGSFFRYGESYQYEMINKEKIKNCKELQIHKDLSLIDKGCIRLNPLKLKEGQVLLIYAPVHFEMFGFNYQKLYPFDNLTEGSIYLLEKIDHEVYILNEEKTNIHIAKQFAAHPKNPLNISFEAINIQYQLIFSNYSIIKICPNIYLTFPLHFAQGNIERQFLQQEDKDCYQQNNFLEQFSRKIFVQWSYFRNLLIFTLLCSQFFSYRPVSDRLLLQFIVNYLLIAGKAQIEKKFIYNIYIIAFSLLVEFCIDIFSKACSHLNFFKKWSSLILLCISGFCFLGMIIKLFNYWRVFLILIIFFINRQNITLFLIKIYFLKDDIAYQGLTLYNFGDIGLLTMWIYINLPVHKEKDEENLTNKAEKLFCGLLIIIVCVSLQSSGSFMSSVLTIYMKIIIVIKMLRIMKK